MLNGTARSWAERNQRVNPRRISISTKSVQPSSVIPAQAGIQPMKNWIPACAEMTQN
jgi:hypothetical protein